MKFFKKAVSLILTAAIMAAMICTGTVCASADAGSKYVVTAKENNDGSYGYRIDITGDIKESLLVNLRSNILYDHTVTAEYFCENRSYRVIIYYRNRFPDTICYVGDQLTLDKNIMTYNWDTVFEGSEPVLSYVELYTKVPEHIAELKTCNSVKFTCTTAHGLKTVFEDTVFLSDFNKNNSSSSEEIKPEKTDISTLTFSTPADLTYTGNYRKSSVLVREGEYILEKGVDYSLTYRNCKNIGTASVTVKGKGKYTGEKTLTYKIVPKAPILKASRKSDTTIKLSWTPVKGAEKYQIYYAKGGGKYKKFNAVFSDTTTVVLKSKYFQKYNCEFIVRAVTEDDGKDYYGAYSNEVKVRLK